MDALRTLQWTETARADLRAIYAYIARDSRVYAQRLIERIKKAAEDLRRFPELGAQVPEWDREGYRERLVGNYRVVYRLRANTVEILTIVHGARQLPDLGTVN
jgi:addiction module RelE/StbE family toxin